MNVKINIFKGHKNDSELYDVIPYNTTPEEEEFYRKLVDMMINHRENLMEKNYPPYKVRRVEGFTNLFQVCLYGLIDGIEVVPGYFDDVASAQEFADAMNTMRKEVLLHV